MTRSDGIPYSMEPMETGLPLLGVRKISNGQFNNFQHLWIRPWIKRAGMNSPSGIPKPFQDMMRSDQ